MTEETIKKATATKKLVLLGHSLVIAVTAEAKAVGLDRGDYAKVTIEAPEKDTKAKQGAKE